ncbi:hypothetical protein SPRG_17287 [Saprolegnia parasitica CBS 223.65]|uniref:F-box domain-containing protein n=1 Tax=Saprolegnia parasitica (strain CBS 223.65) TaxID=695850 RepID=A0A067BGM4_SAPPC|nr:hypothetical protein SPRG_17287 [Saprolegnia parasitica CBS 223.65]KDO17283.1 hypothetical protein SPRG_17287 [Saprolegnia parasitica CBS 223.65]|eukprot:XP_012212010.1 hypothetical protein SPRG_17287 [Saprolegnia parasitica CBS 223.65]
MSKRACVAPISVVDAGVLLHIVQCLSSIDDVFSLLQALPRHALDAPLAALRTLLPTTLKADQWPQVCIEVFDSRYTSTVLTALPAFRSIRINDLSKLDEVLRAASQEYGADGSATIALAAKWGHKIKSIDVSDFQEDNNNGALARILRPCTGLDEVHICEPSDASELEAVTAAAQYVTRMELLEIDKNIFLRERWLSTITTWLASGRAENLGLSYFESADDLQLARCIATAASLTSLTLWQADSVLQALSNVAAPLLNMTKLCLHTISGIEGFLTKCVNLSTLQLLPRLVALRELSLMGCAMEWVDQLDSTPAPRHLAVLQFEACGMDDATCLALLEWASQSPCLKTVTLIATETTMTVASYKVLFEALLTCVGVAIEVVELRIGMRDEIARLASTLQLQLSDGSDRTLTVQKLH